MPALEDIPKCLHDVVTRPAKGGIKRQTVADNAGKMIGRVPANVCKTFTKLLQEKYVVKISCISVGEPTLSKSVDPQRSFKRYQWKNKDREGGGAVIPCKYIVYCNESSCKHALDCLESMEGPEKIET